MELKPGTIVSFNYSAFQWSLGWEEVRIKLLGIQPSDDRYFHGVIISNTEKSIPDYRSIGKIVGYLPKDKIAYRVHNTKCHLPEWF